MGVSHIDVFKGWAETTRQDLEALKALLESKGADDNSRKLAAVALSYFVSRLDLIPDWNEGIGVLDDLMVMRVVAQLTQGDGRGGLPTGAEINLDRMANEADKISAFLGGPIYDKLKSYVAKLVDTAVRGRATQQLLDDPAVRKALYTDLEDELKKNVPIVVNDPADAELRLKAYLTHKLQ